MARGGLITVIWILAMSELKEIRRDVGKIKVKVELILQTLHIDGYRFTDSANNNEKSEVVQGG